MKSLLIPIAVYSLVLGAVVGGLFRLAKMLATTQEQALNYGYGAGLFAMATISLTWDYFYKRYLARAKRSPR